MPQTLSVPVASAGKDDILVDRQRLGRGGNTDLARVGGGSPDTGGIALSVKPKGDHVRVTFKPDRAASASRGARTSPSSRAGSTTAKDSNLIK